MITKCTDSRFEQMLYAYELGMLGDDDRRALELHLLGCEHCFLKAERFAGAAELLRQSGRVRQAIADADSTDQSESDSSVVPAASKWPMFARVSLVAAAVLVILLLRPWRLEFGPTLEAVAGANRLAVIGFENLSDRTDSTRLGEIVAELLITDLSESRYLQVLSSQRVKDILRRLDGGPAEGTGIITQANAAFVAREASATWQLVGTAIETEVGLVLTSRLVEVASGIVLASQEVIAAEGESVFDLVDRLSAEVRQDLNLPEPALVEIDRPVAEVTTHSAEAFRHYLEGIEFAERLYSVEAKAAFKRAIAADSTFAMAYYHLARLGEPDQIDKAVQYSAEASRKEQHYIRALKADFLHDWDEQSNQLRQLVDSFPDEKEAWYRLGVYHATFLRHDSAITYLTQATRIDPLYRGAYNRLTYTYSAAGDFASAIETIDRYISLAPDEANPYDTRGDLYAAHGYPERAAESYAKALDIRPDFLASVFNLTQMRIFQRRYTAADSILNELKQSDDLETRILARLYRMYIPLHQGRFEHALVAIGSAIVQTREDCLAAGLPTDRASFHMLQAQIYAERKDFTSALAEIDTCIQINTINRPFDSVTYRYRQAHYLAEQGDSERADQIREMLKAHWEATGRAPCYTLWAGGAIELARNNPTGAIVYLEESRGITTVSSDFEGHFLLARAYLEAGRLSQAVDLFEALQNSYSRSRLSEIIAGVKLHYYLGLAYEKSQWPDKAAEQFDTFLTIWQNADSGLEAISDAQERLLRLRSAP